METRRVSEGYTDACFPRFTRRVSKVFNCWFPGPPNRQLTFGFGFGLV